MRIYCRAIGALIVFAFILIITSQAQARVLFSDRFDNRANWDGRTDAINQLTGGYVGSWNYIWYSSQTDLNYGSLSSESRYGSSGKGFRFKM